MQSSGLQAAGLAGDSDDSSDHDQTLQSGSSEDSEESNQRPAEQARHAIFAQSVSDAFPDITAEAVAGDADEDILWDDPEFDAMVQSLPDRTVRETQVRSAKLLCRDCAVH